MSQDQVIAEGSIAAGPEYMYRFVIEQQQATSQVTIQLYHAGHTFDDPRMYIYCRQSSYIWYLRSNARDAAL